MKDFIIMAVVLVLFGIWLLVYYLKRRNIADGELCDRVSYLTEKDVNQLNGKPKSEQTEKVSAEASTIGKPSAVGSDAKEEKAVPASEVRSQKETAEEFCGSNGWPEPVIIACQKMRLPLQQRL